MDGLRTTPPLQRPDRRVPLPATLDMPGLACDAVAEASAAAAALTEARLTPLDAQAIAAAYRSDRFLRIDDATPTGFAPWSGFFRTTDGWVRTHANYPWHQRSLAGMLGLSGESEVGAVHRAFAGRSTEDVVDAAARVGALVVPVRPAPTGPIARPLSLLTCRRLTSPGSPSLEAFSPGPAAAPLRGVRVLDLTRVIAGPVATRTLALLGADVLRVDPPAHPEIPWQHLDTGHGKRTTVLDVSDPRFAVLAREADVIVTGYRPGSLEARGFDPVAVASARPGTVVGRISAWGAAAGRGFDSLVQAASGISMVESTDGRTPGVLPAQALDHSAGYLLAAGILRAIRVRHLGSWLVETSLAACAQELLARGPAPRAESPSVAPRTQDFSVDAHRVRTVRPTIAYDGAPTEFAAPRPWGEDEAAWLPRDQSR